MEIRYLQALRFFRKKTATSNSMEKNIRTALSPALVNIRTLLSDTRDGLALEQPPLLCFYRRRLCLADLITIPNVWDY
jgi:hypothetical protein